MITDAQLARIDKATIECESAFGDVYNGSNHDEIKTVVPRVREHLTDLAEQFEQHDLGDALWRAVEAFDRIVETRRRLN